MTDHAMHQDPEGISARAIWIVAAGVVVISAALVVIAWLLVAPPPPRAGVAASPSPLHRELFDRANEGAQVRAAGALELERTQWVDRKAGVIRIPIERAIDAVVADPDLIAAPRGVAVGAGTLGAGAPAAAPLTHELAPSPALPAEVRR